MKTRILTLVLFGGITSLIIYSCNLTNGTISTISDTLCMNYGNEMNTLEVKLIHEMTSKYKAKQLLTINDNLNVGTTPYFNEPAWPLEPYGDARAIWFDLETLKAFIYQIEVKAKNNTIPVSSTELGVRIYYASYPNFNDWESYDDLKEQPDGSHAVPQEYELRHTLVMIPTINKEGQNVDFDPLDSNTYTESLNQGANQLKYSIISTAQMLALTGINKSNSNRDGAQNHGGLRPPPPLDNEGNF